jgi:hypothetical protein
MKKTLLIIVSLILVVILLTACNRNSNEETADGPQFRRNENVNALLDWIRTADDNDPRRIFLETVRDMGSIITVGSNEYTLEEITIHPGFDNKSYQFVNGDNMILVIINPTGIDRTMPERPFDIAYVTDLYVDVVDAVIRETKATVNGQEIPLYYFNGGDFFLRSFNDTRLVNTRAFFEINGVQFQIVLHGFYPNGLFYEEWDNKYLDLFYFEVIEL